MEIERREFPRVNLIYKISSIFGERLLVFHSHTENISVAGVRTILEEGLHISTELEIELFVSDRGTPLKCKGQIIWVKEINPVSTNPRLFDTGIKFTKISNSDQEYLKNMVNTFPSQEKANTPK